MFNIMKQLCGGVVLDLTDNTSLIDYSIDITAGATFIVIIIYQRLTTKSFNKISRRHCRLPLNHAKV